MAKAKRLLKESLNQVDIVIELLDARIPFSSRNPDFDLLLKDKKSITVFNKCDLADTEISRLWGNYYKKKDEYCLFISSTLGENINKLKKRISELMKDKIKKDHAKGRITSTVKTMIVGIPNVGKSALINKIVGRNKALAENRPGVTKRNQWIRINENIQLLDTPGVLWPKFENENTGRNLAFTGAIKDSTMDLVILANYLIDILKKRYPEYLSKRYSIDDILLKTNEEVIHIIGKKRGCIISGEEINIQRASTILLEELRSGKLGRITLENPEDIKKV